LTRVERRSHARVASEIEAKIAKKDNIEQGNGFALLAAVNPDTTTRVQTINHLVYRQPGRQKSKSAQEKAPDRLQGLLNRINSG
jgi:hypothetical protein